MGRFKITDIDNERFYQIPKSLFLNENYKGLGLDAKVIYSFLKDRMELSRKNNWCDKNGDIYLLFTQDEISRLLDVSLPTISRAMKSLKCYNLIDVVRQGLGKPNKIYINKICTTRQIKTLNSDVSRLITDENQDFHSRYANDTDNNDTENNDTKIYIEMCKNNNKINRNVICDYTSNSDLILALNDFIEMRKQNKAKMTDKAIQLLLRKLDKLASNDSDKIEILNQSIMNSWKGLFPLNNKEAINGTGKQSNSKVDDEVKYETEFYNLTDKPIDDDMFKYKD